MNTLEKIIEYTIQFDESKVPYMSCKRVHKLDVQQ